MSDAAFARAAVPAPTKVLNLPLRPYAVGHALWLEALGNPLAGECEGATAAQIVEAVWICAHGMLRVAAFVERLGGGDIDKPGEERNLRERLGDDGARGAFPESGAALHVLRLLVPGEPRGHALAVGLEDRRAGKLVVSGIDAPAALQGQDIGVVVVLAG